MAVDDGYVSGGLRRGRGKEKVRKKQRKGRRRRRSLHGRSVFSQPGGAEQPTVGSEEAASRPRGTHGFGVADLRRRCTFVRVPLCPMSVLDCSGAFVTLDS